ncbi:MAG TPA: HEAT repeat domain-containing protein [Nannocystaceae bacterium]|nr:HEAT repeat domain-containing protein [Nannocystaceae bacterium]
MRRLIASSLLVLALSASACKESDPNKFETHIANIKDSSKRASGFSGLEDLVKTVVTSPDNKDRIEEFATVVIPVFEEIWDEAPEHQEKMLVMLRDIAHPKGSTIWNKALTLDGSAEARKKAILALEGIKKAKATDSTEQVVAEFDKLIANPKNDSGGNADGDVRELMAKTLGALGDKRGVDVLIKAMEQTAEVQPVKVHRAAAAALGKIGDPGTCTAPDKCKVVDALLTVTYRVPDAATSKNIGVQSKQALVAIGDPAIPGVILMLNGKHEEVQKLAAQVGIDQFNIQQTAALILGAMGSAKAVDELLKIFPLDDCKPADAAAKKKDEEELEPDAAYAGLRAVVANALGFIGDEKGIEPLCTCSTASKNPADMFPINEALGRIGGPKAVDCLVNVIKTGEYTKDAIAKADLKYESRWESGRFAILAAGPDDVGKIKEAFAAQTDAAVKTELAKWGEGIKVLESCKTDKDCYLTTLRDSNADWFAREKAAYEVARLGDGDPKLALEIAKAYKVRNPDARVTMAWLPAKMMHGKPCPECAAALQSVLDAEELSTDASYQAPVLMARDSIAKLGHEDDAEKTPAAAPAAPAK